MRILILNWRCPHHPKAGGAEFLTHEVAQGLVRSGNYVEWFSSSFAGAPAEENIDGVRIIRAGRQGTVHLHAFRRYRGKVRGRFDLVIDEINTVPFFTPFWAGVPTLALIFQLARKVWWYESKFPLSGIGYAFEPFYLRPYRRLPAVTISESTRRDLVNLGFTGPITVMPIATEPIRVKSARKSTTPSFIYVGRLAPSKRIGDIVRAFAIFLAEAREGQLLLVGVGDSGYTKSLRRLVAALGLQRSVHFLGRLSSEEKQKRMGEAHLLLLASVREGWGLVVTEANALGTPAVVYDVPGLRDAVRDSETGLVVRASPSCLAEGMRMLMRDRNLYERLANQAVEWSSSFSVDVTVKIMLQAILEAQNQRVVLEQPICL